MQQYFLFAKLKFLLKPGIRRRGKEMLKIDLAARAGPSRRYLVDQLVCSCAFTTEAAVFPNNFRQVKAAACSSCYQYRKGLTKTHSQSFPKTMDFQFYNHSCGGLTSSKLDPQHTRQNFRTSEKSEE